MLLDVVRCNVVLPAKEEKVIHTGTIPCERLWSNVGDFFPPAARSMNEDTKKLDLGKPQPHLKKNVW